MDLPYATQHKDKHYNLDFDLLTGQPRERKKQERTANTVEWLSLANTKSTGVGERGQSGAAFVIDVERLSTITTEEEEKGGGGEKTVEVR